MIQSFNSWSSLNESIASGTEKYLNAAGKKVKLTFKVQSPTKFVMKLINFEDIIINDKLTQEGINAITSFLNEEDSFTMAIGQLTPLFFKENFIVYTILRDGEIMGRTKQKIQFTIEKRKDAAGNALHANVTEATQFIDADSFSQMSQAAPTVLSQLTATAQQAQLPDPEPDEAVSSTETTTGTEETKKESGKKFLYTMRTNSKIYKMEFVQDGSITAKTQDGSDPNGTVSYDKANKKVMWSTTLDDATSKDSKVSKVTGTPLFFDSEITNSQDKSFLEKMFTDEAFRKKTIEEYEAEYASGEITAENLKNLLYYKDGTSIFTAQAAKTAETGKEGESTAAVQANVDALVKAMQQYSPKTT